MKSTLLFGKEGSIWSERSKHFRKMLTSFLNISICFGSYHILFRNKSPEKPVLLPVGLLKKSCLMYQKDRHSSLKRTQGMRRGSSPSLISKNRYLYHQKDKPITKWRRFSGHTPPDGRKAKSREVALSFDKLTIGRETQTLMSAKAMPYSSFITRL